MLPVRRTLLASAAVLLPLMLGACASEPQQAESVAQASAQRKECRASTGTMICRGQGEGTSNVKVVSPADVKSVTSQNAGVSHGSLDKP